MAASLHHARPVLNAAFNSGFRESGVQSLKNLDDPESCPMVAVRTAGLGLEAIIASVTSEVEDSPRRFHCLVSREYIALILKTANERFEANKQRIDKFRDSLKEAMASEIRKLQQKEKWESPEARRQRKRQEGLRAQEIQKMTASREMQDGTQFPSEHDQGYIQLYLDN